MTDKEKIDFVINHYSAIRTRNVIISNMIIVSLCVLIVYQGFNMNFNWLFYVAISCLLLYNFWVLVLATNDTDIEYAHTKKLIGLDTLLEKNNVNVVINCLYFNVIISSGRKKDKILGEDYENINMYLIKRADILIAQLEKKKLPKEPKKKLENLYDKIK